MSPCGERGSGSASSRCHAPAVRSSPPGPDSATRAPARGNATAGTPHLVHVDLRDLHDHVACPCPQPCPSAPFTAYQIKSHLARNTPEPWGIGSLLTEKRAPVFRPGNRPLLLLLYFPWPVCN